MNFAQHGTFNKFLWQVDGNSQEKSHRFSQYGRLFTQGRGGGRGGITSLWRSSGVVLFMEIKVYSPVSSVLVAADSPEGKKIFPFCSLTLKFHHKVAAKFVRDKY